MGKQRKAAFSNGDVIEYLGERQVYDENMNPLIEKGMQMTIIETHPPKKGLGFIKKDEEGDDIIDKDQDGYNVYKNIHGKTRIVWPKDKSHWKLIKKGK
jgi:hypothetical protein